MTRVTAERIGLLVNPTAGKHRGEQIGTRVADLLEAGGREVVDLTGLDASRAEAKARQAVATGDIDLLVVAGGDDEHARDRDEHLAQLRRGDEHDDGRRLHRHA